MKKGLSMILSLALTLGLLAGCAPAGSGGATPSGDPPQSSAPAGEPSGTAEAPGKPLKIGAISSLSGALQDYGDQYRKGFMIGLEYMTDGTNTVAGRPIELIWEDTTNTPDVAKERTLKLLEQDKVELVTGYASSGDAVACLPLFEEYKTVAVVEPAAADAIIAKENWNEYIFRTGRTAGQDALAANAVITAQSSKATIACFAPDSTYGHSMIEPFVAAAEKAGHTIVATEYAPADANDFSPYFLRIKQQKPDYLYVAWAGANSPWNQLLELGLQNDGITVTTGAPEFAQLRGMLPLAKAGGVGYTLYYYGVPANDVNDFLVKRHNELYSSNPDIFASGGMAAAIAICTALEKTQGSTDPAVLIPAMENMEFDSPTGKRVFRAEDHQAMQDLFEVEFTYVEGTDHLVPKYVRNIPADDIAPPITNGRG